MSENQLCLGCWIVAGITILGSVAFFVIGYNARFAKAVDAGLVESTVAGSNQICWVKP